MLPIAVDIAVRLTRKQAHSALPNAPVIPEPSERQARPAVSRSRRLSVTVLHRLAAAAAALAERIDQRVEAR